MRAIGVSAGCPAPGALADLLGALPVRITSVEVERGAVALDDYPGGPRPTSVVRIAGDRHSGCGENVAFSPAEHDHFAAHARELLAHPLPGAGAAAGLGAARPVAAWVRSGGTPYERAALEAALVDLALRQSGKSLADVTGVKEARLRFVMSFAACAHPRAHIQRLRAQQYRGDFKVDVDPCWDGRTREALAAEPGIAILDFKGRGDPQDARLLAHLLPGAILEDPPLDTGSAAGIERTRVARDADLGDAGAVAKATGRGETVNLKAPRMGGPLELLRGLHHVWQTQQRTQSDEVKAYFGGMFEVAVGRSQARQLAALYCADAPNDLAPHLTPRAGVTNPPGLIRFDGPGFGAVD